MPELAHLNWQSEAPEKMKKIRIEYFALLRERRGASNEEVHTAAETAGQLYAELDERYRFGLTAHHLSVAVNDEFADWNTSIKSGDKVVFIPPVAGG